MNEIEGILHFLKPAKLQYPPDCYSERSLLELFVSQTCQYVSDCSLDITDTVTFSQGCIIRLVTLDALQCWGNVVS